MLGIRLNTINETALGEPEQDANSALTELDKGLRSGKVGEQCEAIVRFPKLFEKYPFPILINSSFLKLADVFRMGNNFLRLWVLRVCQQSEKHLDKILNVDEFVRRVFSVLHSNDPVARALALQTLGAVAGIIPDRQNVHHAIRKGLDSHDVVEVDAAIYATTQFAAHSNAFAVSMCNKLSEMIECEATGPELRIKLVHALKYVHGGAVKAHDAVNLLRSLLERFPSANLVRAALAALTAIASHTVVHVPETVEVLLMTAVSDARASVRAACVRGLRSLAPHAALWPPGSLANLISAANAQKTATSLYLDVMQKLVECPAVCASASSTNTGEALSLRQYCLEALLSPDYSVAATAASVLTKIAVFCYKEKMTAEGAAELMLGLESIVISTSVSSTQSNIKALRLTLRCLVDLCLAEPTIYCLRTSRVLGAQLRNSKWRGYQSEECSAFDVKRVKSILEALCALGGSTYCPESIKPAMPSVIAKLREVIAYAKTIESGVKMEVDAQPKCGEDDGTSLVHLCTVICQYMAGIKLTGVKCEPTLADYIKDALMAADGWTSYRVAISALRYAQHSLASDILSELTGGEAVQRWLSALYIAAKSDALLDEDWTKLDEAAAGLTRAASLARRIGVGGGVCGAGCTGCGACWAPAAAFLRTRANRALNASRIMAAAYALCTHPPPAVAHTHAQAVRDAAARAGGCAAAVRRVARGLANVARSYGNLKQCSLYADCTTQRHFLIQQHICNQLVQFMERITANNYQDQQMELAFNPKELVATNLEEKIMLSALVKIQEISDKLFNSPDTKPGITHRHMEALRLAVKAFAHAGGWSRGAACGVPGDTCRLSLSAPRHDHLVPHAQHVALKLDGVLLAESSRKKRKNEDREIKGVQITVTATPHARSDKGTTEPASVAPVMTAVQMVPVTRDFFSAQQLVSLPAGHYTLAAQAALLDADFDLWRTGPYATVNVKVHEDPAAKGNTQPTRPRF